MAKPPAIRAAILVADIVGYSRLAGADEDHILARLRTLRSDLIDPILAVHHGRVVKRTGDGAIVEFRSVVDAVRCAIEVQSGLAERDGSRIGRLKRGYTGQSISDEHRTRSPFRLTQRAVGGPL
jgi:class 3 adenylate cyclase